MNVNFNVKLNGVNTYKDGMSKKINFSSSIGKTSGFSEIKTYETGKDKVKKDSDAEKVEVEKPTVESTKSKEQKVEDFISSMNEELLGEEGNGPRKYIDWYYGDGAGVVDWCAIFVNWIFNHNGESNLYASHSGSSAIAGEDIKTAIANGYGTWYESEYTDSSTTPKAGDVVAFNWVDSESGLKSGYDDDGVLHQWKYETPQGSDHVGYVYKVDDDKIYTIEGNANSYDASAATVTLKEWDRDDIRINGYYRPNYEDAVK